ncbi:hypothetical protein E2C01_012343 [Portunus trituberculatus]|uniref:Uncharacterized protein n=1 Tax=Portunus trituberculatus TaxID=210409 RepID=A0A5B7DDW8_PORTR|nr:hypothetical protein [Portunus trituberculatus]
MTTNTTHPEAPAALSSLTPRGKKTRGSRMAMLVQTTASQMTTFSCFRPLSMAAKCYQKIIAHFR